MRKIETAIVVVFMGIFLGSCTKTKDQEKNNEKRTTENEKMTMPVADNRISLKLKPMQKQHQLKNMRSHLEAIQKITGLLANENYEEASVVAYQKLGSTTEMKMMCSSFGNKTFENLGLDFHKSADTLSEVLKTKDSKASLEALSTTINYCVQCHATYRQ